MDVLCCIIFNEKKKNTWQAEKSEGEKDSSSTYRP